MQINVGAGRRDAMARKAVRGGRRLLLLAAIALAAGGCTGSPRSAPHGHTGSRPAHTVSSCRAGLTRGYSNHRSYPPGIPTMAPPNAHVIACFRTPAEAAAHGFPLPVPRGTVIVRGVFLLPAAPVMGSRCRGIAHRLGFPVPCPGLLPLPVTTPLQPPQCLTVGDCAQTGTNGTVGVPAFVYDDGFAAPPGYHGVSGMPDGHVVIIAARASAVSAVSYARLSFCLGLPAVRKPAISGIRAVVVGCPEGSYETGGHELLRWEHDGVMAAVSFHGHNATNIDLAITVARHMVWTGGR